MLSEMLVEFLVMKSIDCMKVVFECLRILRRVVDGELMMRGVGLLMFFGLFSWKIVCLMFFVMLFLMSLILMFFGLGLLGVYFMCCVEKLKFVFCVVVLLEMEIRMLVLLEVLLVCLMNSLMLFLFLKVEWCSWLN